MVWEVQSVNNSGILKGVNNVIHLLYVFISSNRCVFMVYANTLCGGVFHSRFVFMQIIKGVRNHLTLTLHLVII